MTIIRIPCDTITRLSALLPGPDADVEPIFHTMRLDHGRIICTDRKFGAVEQIDHFEGAWHISLDAALLEQCRIEAQFNGVLTVTPNQTLMWTAAQTTMGYAPQGNIGVYPSEPTKYDDWYKLMVEPALTPATSASGALVCSAEDVARLGRTSPSGRIVFEKVIDVTRPTIMRDTEDHRWCGFFFPRLNDGIFYPSASVPSWLKESGR